jgi:hypothetical protein
MGRFSQSIQVTSLLTQGSLKMEEEGRKGNRMVQYEKDPLLVALKVEGGAHKAKNVEKKIRKQALKPADRMSSYQHHQFQPSALVWI